MTEQFFGENIRETIRDIKALFDHTDAEEAFSIEEPDTSGTSADFIPIRADEADEATLAAR